MRDFRPPRWRTAALPCLLAGWGLLLSCATHAQVVLPITVLNYDASVLPPQLWPTTHIVTRDLALLPAMSLQEKSRSQYHLPYRVGVSANYRDTSGTFGQLNLGAQTLDDVSLEGDVVGSQIDFSLPRDDVTLGVQLSAEKLDLQSANQKRYGLMPYGRWLIPLNQRSAVSLLGTLYYFSNDVESRMAPRSFSDYDTVGASISATLQFDTRHAYKAVSVGESAGSGRSLFGSIAATLHVQSDDAKREVVYQGRIVDEVDDQRLVILGANVGTRLGDRTTVAAECEYAFDFSDYEGSLSAADDRYGRVVLEATQLLSPEWRLRGGIGQSFGHQVDVTDFHINASMAF